MTHLIHYWQRLTHRVDDHDEAADAPVLELAGCFANPVIAARQTGHVMRLANVARSEATPR